MKICDYCGEFKKVRFKEDIQSMINVTRDIPLFKYGSYICEDCNKAHEILLKEREETLERIRKDDQIKWRVQRDKILGKIK